MNNNKGFTLIEVMVALTILSIGLLAVGAMQISAINGNKAALDISEASFIAESKLEELLSVQFDTLVAVTNASDTSNTRYTINWDVSDNAAPNNTKTIDVTVSNIRSGKAVLISTIMAN
jgi:type IV pilus assembly protein PilV